MTRTLEITINALGILALLGALSLLAGCGASALDTHTRALAVLVQTHREAGEVADGAYQRALDAATTAEEVDAAEERWSPVARSLDAAREAILAYGAALGAAVRDAGGDDWMLTAGAALARAIRAWTALGVALREAGTGIELPELPGTVLGLVDLALAAGGDAP